MKKSLILFRVELKKEKDDTMQQNMLYIDKTYMVDANHKYFL